MVSSSMETRQYRKRRWKSSPNKSARAELDFGVKAQSPKKRRLDENLQTKFCEEEPESFTINSFYGKREKVHFPHSPSRRKKVGQVLNKLSGDNIQPKSERNQKHPAEKQFKPSKADDSNTKFDFQSSDTADIELEMKSKLKKTQSSQKLAAKKVPLNVTIKSKESTTPKIHTNSNRKFLNTSASKLQNRPALTEMEPHLQTPVSEKKFFKTRSPASADKCFGSIVIHKGFNLQFTANKKAKSSKTNQEKSKAKPKASKTNRADGKISKMTRTSDSGKVCVEIWKEDEREEAQAQSFTSQSTELDDRQQLESISTNERENDISLKVKMMEQSSKEYTDSAIDTANSEDLFSNLSDDSAHVMRNGTSEDTIGCHQLNDQLTPSKKTYSNSSSPQSESSSVVEGSQEVQPSGKKLFPIFSQGIQTPPNSSSSSVRKLRTRSSPGGSPLLRYVRSKDKKEQMIIDAGQKRFGVTQCDICGMVYTVADPSDETMHHKFHQGLLSALKFPGWKKEHVIQEYLDTGSRIILIQAGDPVYATKKVEEINSIMGRELGFPEQTMRFAPNYKAFLYISSERRIEGCCITEPISEGYPVITGNHSQSCSPQKLRGHRPWYCSDKPKRAVVGISKIWVYGQSRKQGIATRLLDCVRHWSVYGSVIPKNKVAFSDPTPDGKKLAEKYIGSLQFLVYKFQ